MTGSGWSDDQNLWEACAQIITDRGRCTDHPLVSHVVRVLEHAVE
jgi:hypothetical protein